MKKKILIFCAVLTTLSLTAFGYINRNYSVELLEISDNDDVVNTSADEKMEKRIFTDFIYDVGPRFGPIKKSNIDKAISVNDILDETQIASIMSYKSVSVIIIKDDKQSDIRATGNSQKLNEAQLKLLQSSDYSTNFLIRLEYQQMNKETGELEDSYSTPHLTIVPEKQATYKNGKDALKKYLKENSQESRANVQVDKLQPAKLFFTVTKKGTIENIHLDRTSNYPEVDKKMIELITNVPGVWEPAENSKGEKVDQELVISFGLMGC